MEVYRILIIVRSIFGLINLRRTRLKFLAVKRNLHLDFSRFSFMANAFRKEKSDLAMDIHFCFYIFNRS